MITSKLYKLTLLFSTGTCDFEYDMCDFTQATGGVDEFDWERSMGQSVGSGIDDKTTQTPTGEKIIQSSGLE